jgi:uncharacterized RDD family membrane protein YckC
MDRNRFAPPTSEVRDVESLTPIDQGEVRYVGFWARCGASFIDGVVLVALTSPVLIAVYGLDYFELTSQDLVAGPVDVLVTWVFPFVAVVLLWHYKQATPGKMAIRARVVNARTGEPLSIARCVTRYVATALAGLPLGLGLIWIAFDRRKQGWHDKLAGSVVVRRR